MPPKVTITRENIINTAVELIRRDGEHAINARTIAAELGCSTQPIFSNFENMAQLREEILMHGYKIYLSRLENETKNSDYPRYKSYGMAYIKFAAEERELFKFIFMRDRNGQNIGHTADFDASVQMIMSSKGISLESATRMHFEMWTFVHGIATMLVTSFLSLDWDTVGIMLSDVYQGLSAIHTKECEK